MREKVCFGGTFNPIHHGHLLCARAAAEAAGFKTVVLLPTGVPPHKTDQAAIASPRDRLEMCRLAIADVPGFEVDDREVRQSGPSYTILTARQLKQEGWTEVSWLIGSDMLNMLPRWHQAQALLAEVRFIVMARPGTEFAWSTLPPAFQALRQNVVQVPQIDISGTEIRCRVAAGLPIDFLCPPTVCRYIADHQLYQRPTGPR
jgi:nicotinate-nucleotide adenylyltransferase